MGRLSFRGVAAVVTGAGGGIGRLYALELGRRGARVLVNDMDASLDGLGGGARGSAHAVAEEIRSAGGEAVANTSSVVDGEAVVRAALEAFGRVDVLINNAGILRDKSFLKMSEAEWGAVLDVHLGGAHRLCRAAWPHMAAQGYGRIVNIGSSAGLYGNFGQTNYSAAKMGVLGLSNALAVEGAKHGIRVNCVVPVADSRMTETVLSPAVRRALNPAHVVPLVLLLAHESAPTTGGTFETGGGFFSKVRVQRSAGVVLGGGDSVATMEEVADNFARIADMSRSTAPESIAESLQTMLAAVTGPAAADAPDPASAEASASTAADFESSAMLALSAKLLRLSGRQDLSGRVGGPVGVLVYADASFRSKNYDAWRVDLSAAPAVFRSSAPATTSIALDEATLLDLVAGRTSAEYAFMRGRVRVKGSAALAMKLSALLVDASASHFEN